MRANAACTPANYVGAEMPDWLELYTFFCFYALW